MNSLVASMVERLMHRALRRAFRRVFWTGKAPALPENVPIVMYANHHNFYDGYLAWLIIDHWQERSAMTWMADLDRFPFFIAKGAMPFPPDNPLRRAATVRRTAGRLRESPGSILAYFPEGKIQPPEGGIHDFDTTFMARLDRLFPDVLWWPVAMHGTWWGEAHPTMLLGGGTPHRGITGEEPAKLRAVLHAVRTAPPGEGHLLLDGRHGPDETWNFAWMRPWFARGL